MKSIRILPQYLYIEPISSCNLHCTMCYSNIINGPARRVVEADKIITFARRFLASNPELMTIYWCGTGEVFLHPDFTRMVNELQAEHGDHLEQIIQTNGTIKRLAEIDSLAKVDFQVSIDGSRTFHEAHRGKNTYDRTLDFCREAVQRGCRTMTVRTLLTRDNIHDLDEFRAELQDRISPAVYLSLILPFTNQTLRLVRTLSPSIVQHDIKDDRSIELEEARAILQEKYQGRHSLEEDGDSVNNYLSVNTYGVYTCCSGIIKLGEVDDDPVPLANQIAATEETCRSCSMFPCM